MANKTIVAMKKQHDKEMMSVMLGCVDSAAVGGREGDTTRRSWVPRSAENSYVGHTMSAGQKGISKSSGNN